MDRFDVVVVGAGLAGAALAWQLRWRGARVLLVDRGDAVTPSRVAAGLVTPVTGRRLALAADYAADYAAAAAHYRRFEAETGAAVLAERPSLRLFTDPAERAAFAARAAALRDHARPAPDAPAAFHAPLGGFEMAPAARLDVPAYLDATREAFARDGGYRRAEVDPAGGVEPAAAGVRLPGLGVAAGRVAFCTGWDPANRWFAHLAFRPAKGEVLALDIPDLAEGRVVHGGAWLAPDGGGRFRAGATYSWDRLDAVPTAAARADLLARVRAFVRAPVRVIGQAAAVRPILCGGRPAAAGSPADGRVAAFTGLGSKGVLTAPRAAGQLAAALAARSA